MSFSPSIRLQIWPSIMSTYLEHEHHRSFTYIFDNCRISALLELEQDDVYDWHIEMMDRESSISGFLWIDGG